MKARNGAALAILCLSVCVIVMDGTIVNIALPTLLRELGGATLRQLQWIVDAYILVFAGLLMAAGSLGDRHGRKGVLLAGLALFAICSAGAGWASDAPTLIAWRALMGIGAALIFPATLAIIVNLWPEPRARARAIGAWAAMSGLGVAVGPALGGFILEHASWGWVFLINVPVCAGLACAAALWVPTSKEPGARRADPVGAALSMLAAGGAAYAIIEAPHAGWLSAETLGVFAGSVGVLCAFVWWERRRAEPMIELSLFRQRSFAAGSQGIAAAFFGLFGFVFLVTQYFQLVRGYGPFESGVRTLPFALFAGLAAPAAPKLAARYGERWVTGGGLALMAISCVCAAFNEVGTAYGWIVLEMLPLGVGLGFINATGTEVIMASLPKEKAGVGSAVNDTARELGGALGVAAMGSLFASVYSGGIARKLAGVPLPAEALGLCKESVAAAAEVARHAGLKAGPMAEQAIRSAYSGAFMSGFRAACELGAAVLGVGAAICFRALPGREFRGAGALSKAFVLSIVLRLLHPQKSFAEDRVEYRYDDYREEDDRIHIGTHAVAFEKELGSRITARGLYIYDGISGATPTGEAPATGSQRLPMATIEDIRRAITLDASLRLGRVTTTPGFTYSQERDYISRGFALNNTIDFNQKNTTILIGGAYNSDSVSGGRLRKFLHKETYDFLLGVTQVITPTTLLTANLTLGNADGYLADPYRVASFILPDSPDPIFSDPSLTIPKSEVRPGHRFKQVGFFSVTQGIKRLKASVEADYRIYHDDWGVLGNTVSLTWFQKVTRHLTLAPTVRYHRQSAADFYGPWFRGLTFDQYAGGTQVAFQDGFFYGFGDEPGFPWPAEPRITVVDAPARPRYFSADYRLSELEAWTFGIGARLRIKEHVTIEAGYKRYEMRGLDGVTPAAAYPKANVFTIGLGIWY